MGWTCGALGVPFTARAAIEFEFGVEFLARVIDSARVGSVIYAAVRPARPEGQVWALVLLTDRRKGVLCTKPVSEDMGPFEDACPARILDLLGEPANEHARAWRTLCRERIGRPRPSTGDTVTFACALTFTNGESHDTFTYVSGSRFHAPGGLLVHITKWRELDYKVTSKAA